MSGRDRLVILSVDKYERLKRRDRQALDVENLSDAEIEAVRRADPPAEAAGYRRLSSELSAFLAHFGKAPSRKMRISVLNEVYGENLGTRLDNADAPFLDLIVAVARTMPTSEQKALRQRLKAIRAYSRPISRTTDNSRHTMRAKEGRRP